jgi:hypothetical protein
MLHSVGTNEPTVSLLGGNMRMTSKGPINLSLTYASASNLLSNGPITYGVSDMIERKANCVMRFSIAKSPDHLRPGLRLKSDYIFRVTRLP